MPLSCRYILSIALRPFHIQGYSILIVAPGRYDIVQAVLYYHLKSSHKPEGADSEASEGFSAGLYEFRRFAYREKGCRLYLVRRMTGSDSLLPLHLLNPAAGDMATPQSFRLIPYVAHPSESYQWYGRCRHSVCIPPLADGVS